MLLLLLSLLVLPLFSGSTVASSSSVTVGSRLRVQALSPTLLRFEPRGASGHFENRTTFFVACRDGFNGVRLRVVNQTQDQAWLTTHELLVHVASGGHADTVWSAEVFSTTSGDKIWSSPDLRGVNNTLWWPLPLETRAVAIKDYPRFHVPAWGAAPPPPGRTVTPPALAATNGYDFTNNVDGDTYVFLMADSLEDWYAARRQFLRLTGPTPLLPDWAFGTWYSYYRSPFGTEAQALAEIDHWRQDRLPIDVWGFDMNWRLMNARGVGGKAGHNYTYPDTKAYPGLADSTCTGPDSDVELMAAIHSRGLRSFFNDHP